MRNPKHTKLDWQLTRKLHIEYCTCMECFVKGTYSCRHVCEAKLFWILHLCFCTGRHGGCEFGCGDQWFWKHYVLPIGTAWKIAAIPFIPECVLYKSIIYFLFFQTFMQRKHWLLVKYQWHFNGVPKKSIFHLRQICCNVITMGFNLVLFWCIDY